MRHLFTAILLAGLLVAPVAPASADNGDYPPGIPTSCHVGTPNVKVGERVVLSVLVSSNSNVPEVGTVDLAISTVDGRQAVARRAARAARAVVWTKSIQYVGSPVEVTGPKLPKGRYRVTMRFTPDDSQLSGCHNAALFRVGAGGDTGGEDDENPNLPNTGGPDLWILLAGLGLVAVGTGLAGASRRPRALA